MSEKTHLHFTGICGIAAVALGGQAWYLPDVETLITKVRGNAHSRGVILVLTNGGFGSILEKLLPALAH